MYSGNVQFVTQPFFSLRAGSSKTCPNCGYGFRITAKRRAKITFDSFDEIDKQMTIPEQYTDEKYLAKVKKAKKVTGINESVLTGIGTLDKQQVGVGIMDPFFVMGSLAAQPAKRSLDYSRKPPERSCRSSCSLPQVVRECRKGFIP